VKSQQKSQTLLWSSPVSDSPQGLFVAIQRRNGLYLIKSYLKKVRSFQTIKTMKFIILFLIMLGSIRSFPQYVLGKTKKEVLESIPKDWIKLDDSQKDSTITKVLIVQPENRQFLQGFVFAAKSDSCIMEFIGFNDNEYEMVFMKDIEEKWIKEEDKTWKTYMKGKTIQAKLLYMKQFDADGIQFFIKKE